MLDILITSRIFVDIFGTASDISHFVLLSEKCHIHLAMSGVIL